MARSQQTRVEELDRTKPGLRQFIDLCLDGMKPLEHIHEEVEKKFGERIAVSTLSSYKQRRWLQQKRRVQETKAHAQAILELLAGGRAISDIQQALLFERVQSAMDAGAELDPHFLMAEQRKWAQIELKRAEVEQAKAALELKLEEVKRQRERERREVEEAVEYAKDPREIIARIREIYGIAGRSGEAAAVPAGVDQR